MQGQSPETLSHDNEVLTASRRTGSFQNTQRLQPTEEEKRRSLLTHDFHLNDGTNSEGVSILKINPCSTVRCQSKELPVLQPTEVRIPRPPRFFYSSTWFPWKTILAEGVLVPGEIPEVMFHETPPQALWVCEGQLQGASRLSCLVLGDSMSEGPPDTAAIVRTGSDNSPGETVIRQSREIKFKGPPFPTRNVVS